MPQPQVKRLRASRFGLVAMVVALMLASTSTLSSQELRKNTLVTPIPEPVTVEIALQQSEISIRPKQTNKFLWWFWGGIIGYAVAHNVDKTKGERSNQLADELQNLLNGLDFTPGLAQRFESGVNPAILPVLGEVRFRQPEAGLEAPESSPEIPQDLLSVHYNYALIDEFQTLQVTMKAILWDQGMASDLDTLSEGQIRDQARYFQVFTYELTPVTITELKDPKQRAGAWLDMGRDKVGGLLLTGMTTLADALGYDLGSPGMETELRKASDSGISESGRLIQEAGSQRWIRANTGEINILEVY